MKLDLTLLCLHNIILKAQIIEQFLNRIYLKFSAPEVYVKKKGSYGSYMIS